MAKWAVETRVTVRRVYIVEATSEGSAVVKSCDSTPCIEEDRDEQTVSVSELVETPRS